MVAHEADSVGSVNEHQGSEDGPTTLFQPAQASCRLRGDRWRSRTASVAHAVVRSGAGPGWRFPAISPLPEGKVGRIPAAGSGRRRRQREAKTLIFDTNLQRTAQICRNFAGGLPEACRRLAGGLPEKWLGEGQNRKIATRGWSLRNTKHASGFVNAASFDHARSASSLSSTAEWL